MLGRGQQFFPVVVILVTCLSLFGVYRSFTDNLSMLSPQGCRMSWMYPSYVLQSDFNSTWTRLAGRYGLWLYREVDYDKEGKVGVLGSSMYVLSLKSVHTANWRACTVYSRKRRLVTTSAINSVLGCKTVLHLALCTEPHLHRPISQVARRFHRLKLQLYQERMVC